MLQYETNITNNTPSSTLPPLFCIRTNSPLFLNSAGVPVGDQSNKSQTKKTEYL